MPWPLSAGYGALVGIAARTTIDKADNTVLATANGTSSRSIKGATSAVASAVISITNRMTSAANSYSSRRRNATVSSISSAE